jgi:hypothetical protein
MLSQKRAREMMLTALVLAIGTYAHAESALDDIRARGLLRVGVKTDAPPFGSFDEDGRHVGLEIDLARFFARVLFDDDNRAQLVPVTTETRFGKLQAGRVDLLIWHPHRGRDRRQHRLGPAHEVRRGGYPRQSDGTDRIVHDRRAAPDLGEHPAGGRAPLFSMSRQLQIEAKGAQQTLSVWDATGIGGVHALFLDPPPSRMALFTFTAMAPEMTQYIRGRLA